MSKFTEWLVDKGYTTSEDKETIESEISGPEADTQYNELHTIITMSPRIFSFINFSKFNTRLSRSFRHSF